MTVEDGHRPPHVASTAEDPEASTPWSAGAEALARVLGSIDAPIPADVLWSVEGLATIDVAGAIDELDAHGVVTWRSDGRLELTASGRERVARHLAALDRARARGALGRAFRQAGVISPATAGMLLDGLLAEPDATVIPLVLADGDAELRAGRLETAATIYDQVIAAIGRGQPTPNVVRLRAHLRAAYVRRWLGDPVEADRRADEALRVAEVSGDPIDLAIAVTGYPQAINVTDDPRAVAAIEHALDRLEPGEHEIRARVLAARSEALVFADLTASRTSADEALALARQAHDAETFILAAYASRIAHWHPRTQTEMLALGTEMVAAAPGATLFTEFGAVTRLQVFLELGDFAHLDDELAALGERLDRSPRPLERLWYLALVGARAQTRGEWAAADAAAAEAASLAPDGNYRTASQLLLSQQLVTAWHRGDDLTTLDELQLPAGPLRTGWQAGLLGWTCDRRPAAEIDAALDRFLCDGIAGLRDDLTFGPVSSALAMAAAASRSERHAAVLYDGLTPYAEQWAGTGGAVVHGPYALHLGRLAHVLGDEAAGDELLGAALDSCRHGGCRVWEARVLVALGEAGDTAAARAARDLAVSLSMARVEAHARRLLGDAQLPAGLSAREAEVLALVARGGSNRTIAEELFLSVKTVERHLLNAYRKIGARNRADATAFALRHLDDEFDGRPT